MILSINLSVSEFIKTLSPITDFSKLQKGAKIFNRHSVSVDYVDTFDHIEHWSGDREIIFYKNYKGELWNGETGDNWYYYKDAEFIIGELYCNGCTCFNCAYSHVYGEKVKCGINASELSDGSDYVEVDEDSVKECWAENRG